MLDDEDEIKQSETAENPEAEEDGRSVSSDLIRGHINTIILRALYEEDKYGYQIIADIEDKSHGQYSLKQPSLYSALKRLEKEGCITSYWGSSVNGGRRKYFSLTELGKQIAERNQSEWEYSRTIIDSLISDRDFDFSNPAPNSVNMRILRDTTSRVPSSEKGEKASDAEDESIIRAELEREYAEKRAELDRRQAELEEQHARLNDELSRRRSELMKENEWRERELAAREEQLETALGSLATPPDTSERDEVEEQLRDHIRALEEEISALQYDKMNMQETLGRSQQKFEEERAARTQILEEERRKIIDEEQQRTAQLVEEERIRITEEFQQRETVLMRRNYSELRQQAMQSATVAEKPYAPLPERREAPIYSEESGSYKDAIRNILSTASSPYDSASVTDRRAATPAQTTAIATSRSIDGYDFREMKQAAQKDGLRIVTVGEGATQNAEEETQSLVHKGKALFLSSLATFFFCLVLGAVLLGARTSAQIAAFYPYLVWCVGAAILLVAGLAYANHYGERSIRRTSIILIVNSVVIFTLLVILSLIVSLAAQIDFTNRISILNFIVVPIVFSLIVPIFGIVYFLLVKTRKAKN